LYRAFARKTFSSLLIDESVFVWTKSLCEMNVKNEKAALKRKSKNTWNKHPFLVFGFIIFIIIITSKTPQ